MTRTRRWATGGLAVVVALGLTTLTPATRTEAAPLAPTTGRSVDPTLGNGLGRLLAQAGPGAQRRLAGGLRIDQDALTIRDDRGRVLVDLTPQAGVDRAGFRRQATAAGLSVQSVDPDHGTLEGFVALDAVRSLAALPGTGTLAQAVRPVVSTGAATSQGVALQRADKVQAKGVNGAGVTIGALSDSYDTATTNGDGAELTVHAADDVRTGDLPGTGNAKYPTPVAVLEDSPDGTDEGRAMLQIAHDVAPAAKLCFATAFTGQVGFAQNIRRLADPTGPCRADVITDDVSYFAEPMFSDSPLSDAIDDVAKQGVQYFSSAGNSGEQQAWTSSARLLPVSAAKGTDLDFSHVDPGLYSGGLQDMDPGAATDVATNLALGESGGLVDLQWDDPVDVDGATYASPRYTATGAITGAKPSATFSFTAAKADVGRTFQFRTDAIPSGSTDLVLTVTDPDGRSLGTADNGQSPEALTTTVRKAGTYRITVTGYDGATGDLTVDVRQQTRPSDVTTDYNVLLFQRNGAFVGSLSDLNTASGQPSEIGQLAGQSSLQMVIAKAGKGAPTAKRLRVVLNGDIYFSEHSDPLAPAIFGHATAKGATAVAAYDPFRPYLPEYFTSPGGKLGIRFDSAGKPYAKTSTRQVPQLASADGGNTTFFSSDTTLDADRQPNFFGTSAAAPHAAGVAALTLQAAGGPRSLTPAALRARLQRSTFKHDLDPDRASGTSGGLTLTARGPQGSEGGLVQQSMTDPRFFTLSYTGKVALRSVKLYGETASPTALGAGKSTTSAGMVFDPRRFNASAPSRGGYPFTVGATSKGVAKRTVTGVLTQPAGTYKGQYRHLTVKFSKHLKRGQTVKFGVDRDLVVSGYGASNSGNGADELGGATFLPSGKVTTKGLKFVATRTDGKTITGYVANAVRAGWSPLDGYGLLDAEQAVAGLNPSPAVLGR